MRAPMDRVAWSASLVNKVVRIPATPTVTEPTYLPWTALAPPVTTLGMRVVASGCHTCSAKIPFKNSRLPFPRIRPHTEAGQPDSVSYTHLRAHETVLDLVCRL